GADRRRTRLPVHRRPSLPRSGERRHAARRWPRPARGLPGALRAGPAWPAGTVAGQWHRPRHRMAGRTAGCAAAGPVRQAGDGMSMALLFPLGLLALAAWLVPLLVHLARRQQYTPLDFAALRWLQARMRPRQRVRFDEWLLLLVRMLLLAALAVLLARPVLHGLSAPVRPVVVVAPGLDASALRTADDAGDWRWLA